MTPRQKEMRNTPKKEATLWSICNTIIIEETDDVSGDDAVYYEGDSKS